MGTTQIIAEPGSLKIIMTREFDAPPYLLFRAFTEPDLLVQWLGPRDLTTRIDELENRDGGRWRFVHSNAEGHEFGFHGVIHGTPSLDGIVRTSESDGWPGHVSLETLRFEDRHGHTVVRTEAVYQSVEDRDVHLQSGMERGLTESHDRLEELMGRLSAMTAHA